MSLFAFNDVAAVVITSGRAQTLNKSNLEALAGRPVGWQGGDAVHGII